jgi:regulator of ribonuclease activity A
MASSMTSPRTADLVDAHDALVRFCQLPFFILGKRRPFHGAVTTVKCFEDNALVRSKLSEPGDGRVLVVDGGASGRVALLGDQLGELACRNGWRGVIVNGAVRDTAQLDSLPLGVLALFRSPKKSSKTGAGALDAPVSFGGVDFLPGSFAYADDDGLLVSAHDVTAAAAPAPRAGA